jgi:glycine betaine/proline transport system substrate-binding protein
MTRLISAAKRLICAGSLAVCATSALAEPESKDPIKLAMNEWTSQNLLTQLAGRILSKAGYNVEYVTAGYTTQLNAISAGDITVAMEVWETNVGEGFAKMVEAGELNVVSETGLKGGGGWVYPKYAEELCPGLPAWKALRDCAKIFATPETLPKGQLIDFPPEWGNMSTKERLDALDIPFKTVSGGSEGAMLAAFRTSVSTKKPALIYFWWPHPIFAELELAHIDLPAWEPACETDPKWGVNPDKTFDCGEAPGGIQIVSWPGMKQKWPVAYKILESFKVDNDEDMKLSLAIEQGKKLEDVADEWMVNNEARWTGWIEAAKK